MSESHAAILAMMASVFLSGIAFGIALGINLQQAHEQAVRKAHEQAVRERMK